MNCTPTQEAARILRGMAKSLLEEGYVHTDDILDRIHDELHESSHITKSQIGDLISGYGVKTRPQTKSELQIRMGQLKKELREVAKTRDIESGKIQAPKDVTRQKALKKQIEDIKDKIANKDFSKPEPRKQVVYNDATEKAIAERNRLQNQYKNMLFKHEHDTSPLIQRTVKRLLNFRRNIILSSFHTIIRLADAAFSRIALQPIEHATQHLIGKIPGLREVAKKATLEGRFSPRAEAAALKATFSRRMLREAKSKFLSGEGTNDLVYGKHREQLYPLMNMIGNTHAALKVPDELNEYTRAQVAYTEAETKAAIAGGMNPFEVMQHMADPVTIGTINMKAYEESQRVIMRNPNLLSDAVRSAQGNLRRFGKPRSFERISGHAIADTLDFLLPVLRFPLNYTGEGLSYAVGGLKAAIVALAKRNDIDEQTANYIMRNLGKQTIGAVLGAIGWFGYKNIGSFYQEGDNKRTNIPKEGSVFGVPKWMVDTPAGMLLIIGATMHRIQDGIPKKSGYGNIKGTGTVGDALLSTVKGVAEDIPFFSEPGYLAPYFRNTDTLERGAGRELSSSLLPPDLRKIAKALDNNKKRAPQNFIQAIETNIPWLREKVPEKRQ